MNRKAELEISINKRWLERSAFVLVIVVLAAFLYVRWDNSASLTAQATLSEQVEQLEAQNDQLLELAEQKVQEKIEPPAAQPKQEAPPAVQEAPAAPPKPELSGELEIDWTVKGVTLLPADYNKIEIEEFEAEKKVLEQKIKDAEDDRKSDLRNDLRDVEAEIRKLSIGETKYRLQSVTLSFKNGLATEKDLDYAVCWSFLDCQTVKSAGSVVVPSGATKDVAVELKIPSLVTLDKQYYALKLTVREGATQVFSKDFRLTPDKSS